MLARWGDLSAFDAAKDFLMDEAAHPELIEVRGRAAVRSGYLRYLAHLPPTATLGLARQWLEQAWPLSVVAEAILELHSEEVDRERLESGVELALQMGAMYSVTSLVDGLARVGAT